MPRSYNRSVCTEEWHDKAVRGAALTGLGFAALLCVIGGMVVVPFLMRSLHDPGIIDTAPGKKVYRGGENSSRAGAPDH